MPAKVSQVELGCSTLVPIRSSNLAFVGTIEYVRRGYLRIEDKAFPACNIHATVSGSWTFHGSKDREEIDAGTVVFGLADQHFGCAHNSLHPNSGIIAVLLPSAIDEEVGPLFERQILPSSDVAPALMRAAASVNDDEFDSQIFEVFHWCSKWSLHEERSRGSAVRMQRAKRFIEQNAFEQVGLKDIADAVGLNPFVCVRQFKQATGMTPYAYLVHRRMLEAKRLLRSTNRSIEDVAKLSGFSDLPYFSRSFKKTTGVTPSRYR